MSDSGSFKIVGADQLKKMLEQFPDAVQRRAVNTGLNKAGGRLRTYLKRAAPRRDNFHGDAPPGQLVKSIGVKHDRKTGKIKVGLMTRFYYKVLEYGRNPHKRRYKRAVSNFGGYDVKGSPPMHKFFEKVWDMRKAEITQMILDETWKAISIEAGKMHARTKAKNK